MSSTLLPFLYRTKTLQRAWRAPVALSGRPRQLHSSAHRAAQQDDAIPFEWEDRAGEESKKEPNPSAASSTITPAEAAIFKGIFDEIAKGKMPKPKQRPEGSPWSSKPGTEEGIPNQPHRPGSMPRSIVEQARLTDFKDNFLQRYPKSLQNAAQMALGLFALEPEPQQTVSADTTVSRSQMPELHEAERAKWAQRERYETARTKEQQRIDAVMAKCTTDAALWKVMQQEVFSLPEKLGILQATETKPEKKGKRGAKKTDADSETETVSPIQMTPKKGDGNKHIMDVHGPLYSHFLSTGLALLDTAFAQPSPYAFQILPRIKELGLPSYVLGVSTPFYSRLARMSWNQFGDANSALDMLQEMSSVGLYADKEVRELLATIRDHLHGCAWGAQGAFVMAMMEAPPYDEALMHRLEDMEKYVKQSLDEEAS